MALELIILPAILLAMSVQGQTTECFKKMEASTGIFTSPLYPSQYPPNSNCEYILRCPADSYIEITFTHFKLERPFQGTKTDYITILDGGSKNRKQNITYDGSQSAPFVFRSETARVSITFRSDDVFGYSGFRATYKHLKRCKPFTVENGAAECDVNKLDLASHCNVKCDKRFMLEGDERAHCENGEFPTKPTCVVKPEYACKSENFRDMFKKTSKTWWVTLETCVKDNSTGEISKCNYECAKNYVDGGNGAIECVNGVIEETPQCLPDPDAIESCLESQNSSACPFDDQLAFASLLEESREGVKELLVLGRAVGDKEKQYRCDKEVCRRRRSGVYYWVCSKYAKVCQIYFKEPGKIRKLRNRICNKCQVKGCRGKQQFPIFLKI